MVLVFGKKKNIANQSLVGLVVIDAELGSKDHVSMPAIAMGGD
jgi:hypothetical protein